MTKSERIRALYAKGKLTIAQIAKRVGCSDAYVRVVARQRKDGESAADRKWRIANPGYHAAAKRKYFKFR